MVSDNHSHATVIGTVSGTALSVAVNINSADILKTALLAALGAIVSFTVTKILKRLNIRKKK